MRTFRNGLPPIFMLMLGILAGALAAMLATAGHVSAAPFGAPASSVAAPTSTVTSIRESVPTSDGAVNVDASVAVNPICVDISVQSPVGPAKHGDVTATCDEQVKHSGESSPQSQTTGPVTPTPVKQTTPTNQAQDAGGTPKTSANTSAPVEGTSSSQTNAMGSPTSNASDGPTAKVPTTSGNQPNQHATPANHGSSASGSTANTTTGTSATANDASTQAHTDKGSISNEIGPVDTKDSGAAASAVPDIAPVSNGEGTTTGACPIVAMYVDGVAVSQHSADASTTGDTQASSGSAVGVGIPSIATKPACLPTPQRPTNLQPTGTPPVVPCDLKTVQCGAPSDTSSSVTAQTTLLAQPVTHHTTHRSATHAAPTYPAYIRPVTDETSWGGWGWFTPPAAPNVSHASGSHVLGDTLATNPVDHSLPNFPVDHPTEAGLGFSIGSSGGGSTSLSSGSSSCAVLPTFEYPASCWRALYMQSFLMPSGVTVSIQLPPW